MTEPRINHDQLPTTNRRGPSWRMVAEEALVRATGGIDLAYKYFGLARTALLWGLVSDEVLGRLSAKTYAKEDWYRPGSGRFNPVWFRWEAMAIDAHFPPPPGRVLVGAAGGGREAILLASRGYEVVAFDPSPGLAAAFAGHVAPDNAISVYLAAYEDLPRLAPALPGGPAADLRNLGRFDAAVMGWGSLSHVRTQARRLEAIQAFARLTDGPILVSFALRSSAPGSDQRPGRIRSLLPPRFNPERGSHFSLKYGFFRYFAPEEICDLAQAAGLRVVQINDEDSEDYGHAVLVHGAAAS